MPGGTQWHPTWHFYSQVVSLPARSRLAASQLYDPTLGASEFVNAVLEQALGTPPPGLHMLAMDVSLSAITSLFECNET